MSKRARISNSRLNSYGTRALTDGMDVEQYCRNPVLLDMHERGKVIGYVKDLKKEGDDVTGEPVFDEATELSRQRKKQWEFGSVRMVSAGIDIIELSDSKELLLEGQTRPTIVRCKLVEVSIVDIGANDDAIVLMKDGIRIEFGKDGECSLPLLNSEPISKKVMDQKTLALLLGLAETADEPTIKAELEVLKAAKAEVVTLRNEKETLTLAGITSLVDTAITEKRISLEKKEQFITLGKKIGVEELKSTFEAMSPQVKLSAVVGHQGGAATGVPETFKKLSEVPSDQLEEMREKQPDTYRKLYKAEYGIECEI